MFPPYYYPPMGYGYPPPGPNGQVSSDMSLSELKKMRKFLRDVERGFKATQGKDGDKDKKKEEEKKKPQIDPWKALVFLIFIAPFVGSAYLWALITINKHVMDVIQTLVK